MKKLLLVIFIFLLFFSTIKAQDTLRNQDLPFAGEFFVISKGIAFPGINPASTGANHDWDFSDLGTSSQQIDTMLLPSSTNPLLSFFFIDNGLNFNRSNVAAKANDVNLGFTGLNNIFNYYYNTTAEFRQPGFGAVVNSIAIPVAYSPHDVLYKFPLRYNNSDSVNYEYHIDLTSTIGIYYHVTRSRKNKVDGWGELTTPFGTFDVLRIKSTLIQTDSTYIVQLGSGVKTPPVTTIEYKWMAKDKGLPLLQINTTGTNSITQILFQDSIRLTAVPDLISVVDDAVVFPNPASDKFFIKYLLREKSQVSISLFSIDGKQICNLMDESQGAGLNIKAIDLSTCNLSQGNYLVKLQAGKSVLTRSLVITN